MPAVPANTGAEQGTRRLGRPWRLDNKLLARPSAVSDGRKGRICALTNPIPSRPRAFAATQGVLSCEAEIRKGTSNLCFQPPPNAGGSRPDLEARAFGVDLTPAAPAGPKPGTALHH